MIILGLTGSIGMGKTTASGMLQKLGCAVHDSDAAARAALEPEGEGFEQTALAFPECWDSKNRRINRTALADLIFKNPPDRQKLEDILHPIVRRSQHAFLAAHARRRPYQGTRQIAVLDIPLLFETGADQDVDFTAVVSAPYHIQRRRVLSRPGMTHARFEAILKSQMSDEKKCSNANFILPTGLGLSYTYRSIQKMLREILKTGENCEGTHSMSQEEK
ncbi:MAG: dephospho-CoA kinase [Alphaproteobacteria bacterium]|nr:dephospho-CoA kinase [Alphaproteobacteria bacterium]